MHSRELDSIWLVRMNPLASLFARYWASRLIWPGDVERDRVGAVLVHDRPQPPGGLGDRVGHRHRLPARPRGPARTSAVVSRPGAASMSAVVAPLVHSRPRFAGCVLVAGRLQHGTPRPSGPAPTSRTIPQPTPQYEQTVRTLVVPSLSEPGAARAPPYGARPFLTPRDRTNHPLRGCVRAPSPGVKPSAQGLAGKCEHGPAHGFLGHLPVTGSARAVLTSAGVYPSPCEMCAAGRRGRR